ncbi:MAG TPA: hypothetical protein VG944_20115 [Fimbriimonas sp.]|nr:hypothetical protein [Fimbriimonas sp.]
MNNSISTFGGGREARARVAAQNLKCCPLCGAINASRNRECFSCRWSGQFDQSPNSVQLGLDSLIQSCPELAEALLTQPCRKMRWFDRALGLWRRMLRRRVDIQV